VKSNANFDVIRFSIVFFHFLLQMWKRWR